MAKFTIAFVKDNGFKKYYQTIVEAPTEKDARLMALKETEEKGVVLPDEVWCRVKEHKQVIKKFDSDHDFGYGDLD
jgi:hypothetical protein